MARGFNKLCYDYSLDLVSRYQGSNEHFIVIIMNIIIQKENVYFVGDAAGQVMPLSFEGIYYAIKSAKILANSIKNNLNYEKEWNKHYLKKI